MQNGKTHFCRLDLPVKVLDVLADLNLFEPTPIQEKSIGPILSGRDVMGIAQTGTGKTLAYLLPVLKTWKYNKNRKSYSCSFGSYKRIGGSGNRNCRKTDRDITARVIGIYGGKNINTQKLLFNDGCDILVGTPEESWIWRLIMPSH